MKKEELEKQNELEAVVNGDYGDATTPDNGLKNLKNINF